ncbi:MAG: hypothetical protein ACXVW8_08225 [Nocardioidaceae bacterium]
MTDRTTGPSTARSIDWGTRLAGLTLANPVLVASGCGGTGRELEPFAPVANLGGFVTRTITLDPRPGRDTSRLLGTPSGVLHTTGLQNPGLQGFLATELPWLAQQPTRVVVSVWGADLGEYAELARRLGTSPGVAALEVNLCGPDTDTSRRSPAIEPYQAAKVLAAVRRDVPRGVPVLAKLVQDAALVDVARAAVDSGADGLVLVHGPAGLALDATTLRPAVTGSLGGPAVHALAVRSLWEVHRALPDVPLVGVGGIRTGFDALEMLAAGASAVQLGSIVLADPSAPARVLGELADELAARGVEDLTAVVGCAHQPSAQQGDPA